jgi:hypothetical protein
MQFEILQEGVITRRKPGTATAVTCGSRAVATAAGKVVCSYMVQSALGVNDFKPMLSRSDDAGATWHEQGLIWPNVEHTHSIFGSISRAPAAELFFFGSRTAIDQPGETFWSESAHGLKPNELIWARSIDDGVTWSEPAEVPMPIAGSAEAAGPMCVTRGGRWVCCYSPCNTFDPNVVVEHNQVVCLSSEDHGKTWGLSAMLRFPDKNSQGAEAWVVELADGRLLGAAWHNNETLGGSQPNAYALSHDGGLTWSPTGSTGILGQSSALAALPDGRVLFVYNQRQHGEIGVWLAVARSTEADFRVEANAIIWRAQTATQNDTSRELKDWTDFSFGEPSIALLPDGILLVTLWCIQDGAASIRYVKVRIRK